MSSFSIGFLNQLPEFIENERCLKGIIRIGLFQEHFYSSLSYWSQVQYRKQWVEGMKRICLSRQNSCLLTSIYNPVDSHFLFWWVLFPENEVVYLQNQVLFLDSINGVFNPNNPYEHIRKRETHSEEGFPISEWKIRMKDLEKFLQEEVQAFD